MIVSTKTLIEFTDRAGKRALETMNGKPHGARAFGGNPRA